MLKNISREKIVLRFGGYEKEVLPGATIELEDSLEKNFIRVNNSLVMLEKPVSVKVEEKQDEKKEEVKKNANIGNKRRNNK